MPNSEILNEFDEKRAVFKPYGLTCERWTPGLMRKADRHNEIELNYFPEGTITYFFRDNRVTIPPRRLAVFWALVPHQIVDYDGTNAYYVCTIPFSLFLEWKLPASLVERILSGDVVVDSTDESFPYDEFLIKNWINDVSDNDSNEVMLLEMRARLHRLALMNDTGKYYSHLPADSSNVNKVESIAIFVAQNYSQPITADDIGEAVGLHPDYANAIFKKAFGSTLTEYITAERISHAQRNLLTTEKSITEIAFDSGFNSIGRFNAAFQKINRRTPREYRKKYRNRN